MSDNDKDGDNDNIDKDNIYNICDDSSSCTKRAVTMIGLLLMIVTMWMIMVIAKIMMRIKLITIAAATNEAKRQQ